jgi:hypothetical protein
MTTDALPEILDPAGGDPVATLLALLLFATGIIVWHVAGGIGEALHIGIRVYLLRLVRLDGDGRPIRRRSPRRPSRPSSTSSSRRHPDRASRRAEIGRDEDSAETGPRAR